MIICTMKFDNAICTSRFIKTNEKGEFLMEFTAITLDGKLRELIVKTVSEVYVCARLNSCRTSGGTMAVVKNNVVTYKCDYE